MISFLNDGDVIAIDIGHNAPSGDTGARGIKFEDDLARQVGFKLAELLTKNSPYKPLIVNPTASSNVNQSLAKRCENANNSNAALFVSIHFNAFNKSAHGAEVYVSNKSGKAYPIADNVLDNICNLGFFNRGVKEKNFYVIRKTAMPAMLIECGFVDSSKDMNLFDVDSMAKAIAEGIIGKKITPKPELQEVRHFATLIVNSATWLKPSTEQSSEIEKSLLTNIEPGEYAIEFLSDEEGHFEIRFTSEKYNELSGFIFQGHVTLK